MIVRYSHDLPHALFDEHDIRFSLLCNLLDMIDPINKRHDLPHRQVPIPFHLIFVSYINQRHGHVPCVDRRRIGIAGEDAQLDPVELVYSDGSFGESVEVGKKLLKDGVYPILRSGRREELMIDLQGRVSTPISRTVV